MSELSILKAFVQAGMTPVGACAMGGNIQAESGFKSNIAQRGMTKLSDEEYTAVFDCGDHSIMQDGVGYGLCQWTYHTRKADLWNFARIVGKSVGDEDIQVQFCINELQSDYPDLWRYLCETQDLSGATGRICTEYERPAINNIETRARYANDLYMWYADKFNISPSASLIPPNPSVASRQLPFQGSQGEAMPTIKRGDKSPEAHYLRKLLDNLGYDTVWDGVWAALVDYQQKRGLTVDGICGAETWKTIMQEGK